MPVDPVTGKNLSFGEWLQLGWWDLQATFGDKDAKAHAEALRAVNSQQTAEDRYIYELVESEKIEYGGIVGTVRGLIAAASQGFEATLRVLKYVLKFFPVIIIIGLAWWLYAQGFFRVKKVNT